MDPQIIDTFKRFNPTEMKLPQKTANLQLELLAVRKREHTEGQLLSEISKILSENGLRRDAIRQKIQASAEIMENSFDFDALDTDRIFHLNQIRRICINYRLRFLPTDYFKGGIPAEAVSQIRRLEDLHQTELGGFHIVAPTKTFELKNFNDPLLFVPIGNGYFYLVHKWGNDLSYWRKVWVWPYRNLATFTVVAIFLSLLVTWLTPETKLAGSVPMASAIIFLFAFKSVFAVGMYGFFMLGKKFNSSIWDSVYYNN